MAYLARRWLLLVAGAAFPFAISSIQIASGADEFSLVQLTASVISAQQKLERTISEQEESTAINRPQTQPAHVTAPAKQRGHGAAKANQVDGPVESKRSDPPLARIKASVAANSNASDTGSHRMKTARHKMRTQDPGAKHNGQPVHAIAAPTNSSESNASNSSMVSSGSNASSSNVVPYMAGGGICGAATSTMVALIVFGQGLSTPGAIGTSIAGGLVGAMVGFMLSSGSGGAQAISTEQPEPYTEKLRELAYTLMAITANLSDSPEAYNKAFKSRVDQDFQAARTVLDRIETEIQQGKHATKEDFHEIAQTLSHGRYVTYLTADAASANAEVVTANDVALIEADDDVDNAEHPEDIGPAGHLDAYEGDMIAVNDTQQELFRTITEHQVNGNSTLRFAGNAWRGGTVYYCFAPDVSVAVQHIVWAAIMDIENAVPCIKFYNVGHKSGTSHDGRLAQACQAAPAIFIQSNPNEGCYSYVGMIGQWKSQKLQLQDPGCVSVGTAVHEIGHALGMAHEQSRSDRDRYVTINWWNIASGTENNFKIHKGADTSVPYDFLSVMHYDAFAFAKDRRQPTIVNTRHPRHTANEVGQRIGLANSDIEQLEKEYSKVTDRSCYTNKVAGMGCLDKPDKTGHMFCSGISQCSARAVTHCCGCGGGVKVQCYENTHCPSAEALPPPEGADCIVDKSNLFSQPFTGCVFSNVCSFKVKWKCPALSCTHSTDPGGLWTTNCGSQRQSEICIPGRCKIWKA